MPRHYHLIRMIVITRFYNTSSLELDCAKTFEDLAPQLENRLTSGKIVDITSVHDIDNPMVIYKLKDAEGIYTK